MNIPATISPGEGNANLQERARAMTQAPHQMSPAAEAASQLDTTTVRASQASDLPSLTKQQLENADDAATEPADPRLVVNRGK